MLHRAEWLTGQPLSTQLGLASSVVYLTAAGVLARRWVWPGVVVWRRCRRRDRLLAEWIIERRREGWGSP